MTTLGQLLSQIDILRLACGELFLNRAGFAAFVERLGALEFVAQEDAEVVVGSGQILLILEAAQENERNVPARKFAAYSERPLPCSQEVTGSSAAAAKNTGGDGGTLPCVGFSSLKKN